jgi:hypothetical protein
VFVGGFGVDGARAVAANRESSESLLDELGLLVDHNLLTVAPGPEASRDSGCSRRFASSRRRSSDRTISTMRCRGTRRTRSASLRPPQRSSGVRTTEPRLDRLIDDLDDLRAALIRTADAGDVDLFLRLATALAPYWRYYGDIREGRRWLQQAVAVSGWTSPIVRARVLRSGGWLETVAGELDAGRDMLEQSLALFEGLDEPREIADHAVPPRFELAGQRSDRRCARALSSVGSTLPATSVTQPRKVDSCSRSRGSPGSRTDLRTALKSLDRRWKRRCSPGICSAWPSA